MTTNESIKNFSFVGIGRIVAVSTQAIFYLIFASMLGPESYGKLSVIIALAGTFSVISRLGLPLSLQVFRAKGKSKTSQEILTLFIISTSIAGIILLMIEPLAAAISVSASLFFMYQQDLMGQKKYKKTMLNSILRSSIFIILPFVLYFFIDIPGVLIGMTVSYFFVSIPHLRSYKIKSFLGLKKSYKVIIHNFGIDSSVNLSLMIDKLLIVYLFSYTIVGIYQFSLQIVVALATFPGILISYLISEEVSGDSHKKIIILSFLTAIIVTLLTIFVSPYFVTKFFPEYIDGIFALQIISLTIIPGTLEAMLLPKLLVRESTKIGFSAIIRISSLLILIVALGQPYGLVGLSLAVLFSMILTLGFVYFIYRKERKIPIT